MYPYRCAMCDHSFASRSAAMEQHRRCSAWICSFLSTVNDTVSVKDTLSCCDMTPYKLADFKRHRSKDHLEPPEMIERIVRVERVWKCDIRASFSFQASWGMYGGRNYFLPPVNVDVGAIPLIPQPDHSMESGIKFYY